MAIESGLLNVATPWSDAGVDLFRKDRVKVQHDQEQQAAAREQDMNKKQELLADPGKIDSMVANSLLDVFPYAHKAKGLNTAVDKVGLIDETLKKESHPFAGSARTIKTAFAQALSDPRFTGYAPVEVLSAIKKQHFNTAGEDGKSLLEKGHEYKYDKDNGPFRMKLPFMESHGDKNTLALPGYEEYSAKRKEAKPYDTSLAESIVYAAVPTLALGLATGGLAAPVALAERVALQVAIAYPEFKLFDAAANKVAESRSGKEADFSDLAAELALGGLAMMGGKKIAKFAGGKVLAKAVESGKLTESAVALVGKTGLAADAVEAWKAGKVSEKALAAATDEARVAQRSAVLDMNEFLGEQNSVASELRAQERFGADVPGDITGRGALASVFDETAEAKKAFASEVEGSTLFGGKTKKNVIDRTVIESPTGMPIIVEHKAGKLSQGAKDLDSFWKEMEGSRSLVNPDHAELMGLGNKDLKIVNERPGALFNYIQSPVAEQLVLDDLAKGIPAEQSVPLRFAQEAAVKALDRGPMTPEMIGKEVDKHVARQLDQSVELDKWLAEKAPFSPPVMSKEEGSILNQIGKKKTYPNPGFRNTLDPKAYFGKGAALIGTTAFAGGLSLFGGEGTAEASTGSAVGKAAESFMKEVAGAGEKIVEGGKKLLDGGIELKTENLLPKIANVTNKEIKSHLETVTSPRNAFNPKLYEKTSAALLVEEVIIAADYKIPKFNKALEEMGIDTSKRVGYHGTPAAESTLKGHSEQHVRAGLFNDKGEFVKYYSHDPRVSGEKYAGDAIDSNKAWLESTGSPMTNLELLTTLRAKTPPENIGTINDYWNRYRNSTLHPADAIEEFKKAGADTSFLKVVETGASTPNIQKVFLDVKKTFNMEGTIEEHADVLKAVREFYPDFAPRSPNELWRQAGEIGQSKIYSTISPELDKMGAKYKIPGFSQFSAEEKLQNLYNNAMHPYGPISSEDATRLQNLYELTQYKTSKKSANDLLRSLGYDSITHLGRGDGWVTIALKPGVEKPFFDGTKLADNVLKSVAGLTGFASIMSLMSPGDANASPGSAAGVQVSKAAATWAETIGLKGQELLDTFAKNRWFTQPVSQTQTYLPESMEQVVTAPNFGRLTSNAKNVMGKTSTLLDGVSKFLSNGNFAELYGTLVHNPAVQLASAQSAMSMNVANGLQVSKNIAKLVPGLLDEAPKVSKEIAEYMKPVQAAYDGVAIPLAKTEFEISNTKRVISNLEKTMKEEGVDSEIIAKQLEQEREKLSGLESLYGEYRPGLEEASSNLQAAHNEMAKRYPSARISLAAEGKLDASIPLTYEEKAAVKMYQDVFDKYKVRAKAAGLETIEGPYVKHSRDLTEVNKDFVARLEALGIPADTNGIPLTSFFSRTKYSQQMIPDILRNVAEYIPDAEKRINVSNFWKVGQENGWDAVAKNDLIKGNKVWSDYFDRLRKAYNPAEDTAVNRMADRIASLETLRLLALSPSAPFKHLFKNEGTWATLGFTNSMKHIPDAVATSTRIATNNAMYALGLTEKMVPKGVMDDFINATMKQRQMINPLADIERPDKVVGWVDQWLDKLNNVGGVGIRAVEAFDRVHTIQAAFDMAVKKGMTAEQAMSGIYSTILKNNFLSGALNPEWMHNPKIRLLALFQNTPFKILERRVTNGIKAGQDVKTAWGTLKNQNLEGVLNELNNLRKDIMSGQNELKQSMIYEALTASKDAYGNSVTAQFMREWVIAGAVVGVGGMAGVDLTRHSFHLPFIKDNKNDMAFATSPIVEATWKTVHGGGADANLPDDEKAFFPSRFYRNWTQSSGGATPLILHKMKRISENDIPEMYKDGPLKYLFSVPSTDHK